MRTVKTLFISAFVLAVLAPVSAFAQARAATSVPGHHRFVGALRAWCSRRRAGNCSPAGRATATQTRILKGVAGQAAGRA
jgi:hypothetical protein